MYQYVVSDLCLTQPFWAAGAGSQPVQREELGAQGILEDRAQKYAK